MTTAVDLHVATLELLNTLDTMTVYDGTVPDSPPADQLGRVYPYVVLWPMPGTFPDDAAGVCDTDTGELSWTARVTVASGSPTWTLDASELVRRTLSRVRLLPRAGLLREPPGFEAVVTKDPDTHPVRWFAPLVFITMSA